MNSNYQPRFVCTLCRLARGCKGVGRVEVERVVIHLVEPIAPNDGVFLGTEEAAMDSLDRTLRTYTRTPYRPKDFFASPHGGLRPILTTLQAGQFETADQQATDSFGPLQRVAVWPARSRAGTARRANRIPYPPP
jgi:hypothetical protein